MSELRAGVVHWEDGDGIAAAIRGSLTDLGWSPIAIAPDGRFPADLDIIILWGPLGSLAPTANRLIAACNKQRPKLVLWQTEQAWNPAIPAWLGIPASKLRSWLDRRRPFAFALRFRHVGDMLWLKRHGLPDVLAVSSDWYADFLRRLGIDCMTAYVGAFPNWGADLGMERDIPILWLGKPGSSRRSRLLKQIRTELERLGVEMVVVDGIEAPYVFGQERVVLLNRTRIVLNLLRQPWDANAVRYYLAALNGAMILTEPTLPHNPFKSGVHLAMVEPDRLAEAAVYFLQNEPVRKQLADNARLLVSNELTMSRQLSGILASLERR